MGTKTATTAARRRAVQHAAATAMSAHVGELDLRYEQCDDGNTNDNDGCRNNCTPARCGDEVTRDDLQAGQGLRSLR